MLQRNFPPALCPTRESMSAFRRGKSCILALSALLCLHTLITPAAVFAQVAPNAAVKAGVPAAQPDFDVQSIRRETTLPFVPNVNLNIPVAAVVPADAEIQTSALTETVSRIWRPLAPLTAPSNALPQDIARAFVLDRPQLFGLTAADANAITLVYQYRTEGLNITHVTLGQQFKGIPVFMAEAGCQVTFRGEVAALSNSLVPELAKAINTTTPKITAEQALLSAFDSAGLQKRPAARAGKSLLNATRAVEFTAPAAISEPTTVALTYFQTAPRTVRLAWEMTLWMRDTPDVYHILIDAETGELLFRKNQTMYDAPHGLIFADDAPQDGTPYLGVTPPVQSRVDAPFNGGSFFTSTDVHYDWWAGIAATTTLGNNVSAQDDTNADNSGGTRPTSATSNFNFALDLNAAPSAYLSAAVTNLFYWCNRMHDLSYSLGFTEAARNFQTNNFGLGGSGNDRVQADAQDGSGTNNANFSTPRDGFAGRMQMYIFTRSNPYRDGDLDNGIICHEYGHGISGRLIGNGSGLGGIHGGGMNEGMSDFWALMATSEPTDDINGRYPIGGWAFNNFAAGIRRQPYSTNPAVFTRTFAKISDSTAVHSVGEIWCNTLWKIHALLVFTYGYSEGHRRTMQIHVDACKLSPSNPTFLDLRNAWLTADQNRYGSANYDFLWSAFASMGMGVSASTTGINDSAPQEAFNLPTLKNLYVDRTYTGTEAGTPYRPFRTVAAALNAASATVRTKIYVRANAYNDKPRVTKPVQIVNWGNTNQTRIGKQ